MSVHYLSEPELTLPDMVCAWPGIGQVALLVADTLRTQMKASLFAEIDPEPFFYPSRITVHKGLLQDMEFPTSRFYVSRAQERDLILFIGEAQPSEEDALYGNGRPTYRLANLVLDVAEKYHCRRIYTSGAAVTQIHHATPSRVWAVPNDPTLIEEMTKLNNTVLMTPTGDHEAQGFISGLNGLLIGVARNRGMEAVCLMGEVPYYLQGLVRPYPGAAQAVLECLARLLHLSLDLTGVQQMTQRMERDTDEILAPILANKHMAGFKKQLEALRQARRAELGPITDQEQKAMLQHIEELFETEDGNHRRLV